MLLLVALRDDLKSSIDLYDRVEDEWQKSGIVWFTTLNELRESRQSFVKNREMLVLLEEEELRQRIFRYYHRSSDHLGLLENQQRRKYDIQSKLNDVMRDLQLRDPQLPRDQALPQAIALMHSEDQELAGINTMLPQSVHKVRDFRLEAKEIFAALPR